MSKMTSDNELTIDIYQYVEWDNEDNSIVYFNTSNFLEDVKEYINNDNPNIIIKEG